MLPLLPIAQELARRGHALRWYTGRKYAPRVTAAGAECMPFVHARDFDDADFGATFPGRDRRRGLRQLQYDVRQIFVGGIEGNMDDLRLLQREWPADAVLADQTLVAALLHAEVGGRPVRCWASCRWASRAATPRRSGWDLPRPPLFWDGPETARCTG